MRGLAALSNHRLTPLVTGSASADLADWIDYLAVVALLVHWQSGPWALAWFTVALSAPRFLIGPFAGILVDRLALKQALLATNLGRALVTGAMILAPNTAVLLILVALRASIGSASNPARQAVIPMLVRSDQLTAVNSALFTIRQITRVLGPAFGWALLLVMSAQWVFAVTSLLAIVAALAFGLLEIPERKSRPHPSSSTALLGSLKEGVDEVTRKPLLFAATFYFVAGMFATFLYDGFAVLFLNDVGQPASFLGAVMAALGAGGIVGAFAVGRLKLTSQSAFACMAAAGLVTGILIAGAGMLAYVAQSTSGPGLLALFFAVGAASSFALIPYRTVVQLETSKDKIGRVTALSDALVAAAMFSAPFLGGLLISAFRVGSSFLVSGALTIGIAGLTWLLVTRTNASGLIEPNRTGPQ